MAVTCGTFAGQIDEERGGVGRVYAPDSLGSITMIAGASGSVTDTFKY